jgi:hypothetical protein
MGEQTLHSDACEAGSIMSFVSDKGSVLCSIFQVIVSVKRSLVSHKPRIDPRINTLIRVHARVHTRVQARIHSRIHSWIYSRIVVVCFLHSRI